MKDEPGRCQKGRRSQIPPRLEEGRLKTARPGWPDHCKITLPAAGAYTLQVPHAAAENTQVLILTCAR